LVLFQREILLICLCDENYEIRFNSAATFIFDALRRKTVYCLHQYYTNIDELKQLQRSRELAISNSLKQ